MSVDADLLRRWSCLTDKQRECLDLLLEHKTSKEIALALDISKHTVDQRFRAARKILGAANRAETAVLYARLRSICDRVAYDPVDLPSEPILVPSDFANGDPASVPALVESRFAGGGRGDGSSGLAPPFREIWRPDHSPLARAMIMVAMLTAIVLAALSGLSIALTLTRLVAG